MCSISSAPEHQRTSHLKRSKEAKKQRSKECVILSDPRALLRKAATGGVEGSGNKEQIFRALRDLRMT